MLYYVRENFGVKRMMSKTRRKYSFTEKAIRNAQKRSARVDATVRTPSNHGAIPNLPLLRNRSTFARSYKNMQPCYPRCNINEARPQVRRRVAAQLFQTSENPNSRERRLRETGGRRWRAGARCKIHVSREDGTDFELMHAAREPRRHRTLRTASERLDRSRVGIAIVGRLSVTFTSLLRRAQLQPGVLPASVTFSSRHPSRRR